LTGQFAHTHGVIDNNHPVPREAVFFPELLQKSGYETAFIGKWHMGGESDDPQRGFDRWVSFRGQGSYLPARAGLNVDGRRVPQNGYITDELTDYALDWLAGRGRERPFFLYLSHKAVHALFVPAERHAGRYMDARFNPPATMAPAPPDSEGIPRWVRDQRNSYHGVGFTYHGTLDVEDYYRRYCETLLAVDESVGRIFAHLERSGQLDSTLILFMGDNGFLFGEHGLIDKRCAYEPSMRIPMLAHCPDLFPGGGVVERLVANIDVAPTLLEAAGLAAPSSMQGKSFLPLVRSEQVPWREALLYEYFWERNFPHTPTIFALRTEKHKFIRPHGIWDIDELYDLEADPGETRNLFVDAAHKPLAERMRARLFEELERTGGLSLPLRPDRGATQNLRDEAGEPGADFPRALYRKPDTKAAEKRPRAGEQLPNVVLIMADDLGYGDPGCYGGPAGATPNLDRLAAEGMRFTDFSVAQAVCSASRAALLTGCYPNRVGILGALGPKSTHGIASGESTIAEVLRSRGYATAIVGKWHLGHHEPFLPAHHGFDEYFGLPYSNDMWPRHPTDPSYPDLPLIDGTAVIARNPDQRMLTGWYGERAVEFIEAHRDRPFFLFLAHGMPHVPLHAGGGFAGKSGRGTYGDVIAEVDDSVGRVMEALERSGVAERTLVVFLSDNGPWLRYGNHAGSTAGLREGKGTTFEGGVRVPCLARWPGVIPAGSVCREPLMSIDWLPTIARAAGAEIPRGIDGLDLGDLLRDKPGARSPHEALYYYWGNELQAVRSRRWKLHFPHEYVSLAGEPGRDGQPGPMETKRTGLALYNLETDPGERDDVSALHPEVVERLEAVAERARAELGDSGLERVGSGVRVPGSL
jgi:arylsulfatase A-like enzyme